MPTLHSPSGPLHGSSTELDFAPESLRFSCGAAQHSVGYAQLQLRRGGWDGDQLELTWEDQGHWMISLPKTEALPWLTHPPAALAEKAQNFLSQQKQARTRRGCGWLGLLGFLSSPFLLLAVFWVFRVSIGSWLVSWVSIQHEVQFGDTVYAQLSSQLTPIKSGPALAAVEKIGQQLTQGSAYTYRWHLVADDQVNAFAVPGGHIIVNSGLLKKTQSAEALAGVLAHEVQHIELRHSLSGVAGDLLWHSLIGLVWDSGSTLGSVAGDLGKLSFSRDDETEADSTGLARMATAGINPEGMVQVMAMLAKETGGSLMPLLQTHPASSERSARLSAAISELPPRSYTPLAYDWQQIRTQVD